LARFPDDVLLEDPRFCPVNCYERYDVKTGEQVAWFGCPKYLLQQPAHISCPSDAPEGDGGMRAGVSALPQCLSGAWDMGISSL